MGGALKGLLNSGVGLVAEAISHHSQKSGSLTPNDNRSSRAIYVDEPPPYSPLSHSIGRNTYSNENYDEQRYHIQEEQNRHFDERERPHHFSEEVKVNFSYSPVRQAPSSYEGLSSPVIIPQRRPNTQDRGFAIAYSPCLNSCGIDQATFLDFIFAFNKASETSPVLDVVNLAAFASGFAPGIAPMIVSMAVPVATKVAKNAQTKTGSANYLRRANAEIFEPRGLVAFVATFKPGQTSPVLSMDTQTHDLQHNIASGLELPPSAPLVFFNESAVVSDELQNPFQRSTRFVSDYMDRRKQVEYMNQHPEMSHLGPRPQFRSPHSDPDNQSGGLIPRARPQRRSDDDEECSSEDDYRSKKRSRKDKKKGRKQDGLIGGLLGATSGQRGNQRPGLIGGLRGMAFGEQGLGNPSTSLVGGIKGKALGNERQNGGLISGFKGKLMQEESMFLVIAKKNTSVSSAIELP
ncbi:hypothetical protein BT63DRAFT_449262 [Microthyrium microscopicum]|uniref:Uncharacterized protein n=1 Tax=Microthyrium microscopicum TaxID=703497 RepID=A0A6A6USA4_9PEZI|nr:hypothetical protein BT63DRAFT_449262 [Microthyrium microscopicum]